MPSMPHAVDLVQLVGILCLRQNSSILALEDRGRQGEIYFSDGEIVHASCDGKRPESALFELLSWRTGTLRLAPIGTPPEPSLDIDTASMILLQSACENGAGVGRPPEDRPSASSMG